eukprot:913473-Prymnesium_polylepis.1
MTPAQRDGREAQLTRHVPLSVELYKSVYRASHAHLVRPAHRRVNCVAVKARLVERPARRYRGDAHTQVGGTLGPARNVGLAEYSVRQGVLLERQAHILWLRQNESFEDHRSKDVWSAVAHFVREAVACPTAGVIVRLVPDTLVLPPLGVEYN